MKEQEVKTNARHDDWLVTQLVDAEFAASLKNYRMSASVLNEDDVSSGHIERQTW